MTAGIDSLSHEGRTFPVPDRVRERARIRALKTYRELYERSLWCTADIGWVTGHTYSVYGPLCARATSILFEGIPTYPLIAGRPQ